MHRKRGVPDSPRIVADAKETACTRVISSPYRITESALGLMPSNGTAPGGVDLLATTLERFVALDGPPAVLVIDFASRLVVRHEALSQSEHQLFSRALILSHSARIRPAGPDLPDWFLVGNPRIRHIPIAKPDHLVRRTLVPFLVRSLPGAREAPADQIEKAQATFVDETEGLLLLDLNAIAQLARSEGLSIGQISDAVRRYKVGVTEDPWRKINRAKISSAEEFVRRRVKGQAHAVTHMLDVIKRAIIGRKHRHGGNPEAVIEPSGNAIAAATPSRSGVLGPISSRAGNFETIAIPARKREAPHSLSSVSSSEESSWTQRCSSGS